jgi:hypothetical protein
VLSARSFSFVSSQPRIDHRLCAKFCIFARSENRPLSWRFVVWQINDYLPLASLNSHSDRVLNAAVLHEPLYLRRTPRAKMPISRLRRKRASDGRRDWVTIEGQTIRGLA